MLKLALIALGGAVGSLLRHALHGSVQRWVDTTWPLSSSAVFPFGTLAVNAIGCLAIGILAGLFAGPWPLREEYRVGLTVGMLGGFTTFSTFGLDAFGLTNAGHGRMALVYMLASCVLGLAAVFVGYRFVTRAFGMT
ncbi:MAG: fluoride efflux transporter CrcB [Pirellulales bacterium]